MKLSSLVLFCLLTATHENPTPGESENDFGGDYSKNIRNKIIGGRQAKRGVYPYIVSLQKNFRHTCGGSVLNSQWILTAAHCVYDVQRHEIIVIAGTSNLKEGGDRYGVDKLIIHPKYVRKLLKADIALIKVLKIIIFSACVKPIQLPSKDICSRNNPVVIPGWGRTRYLGTPSTELRFLRSKIYDHRKCLKFSHLVTTKNICTFTREGRGMCHGDSGGPVVAKGVQIGIVSWARIPCAGGTPDVHTKVFSYLGWIRKHIRKKIDKSPYTDEL